MRKIFIILICLLIASPAFAGEAKKQGKNVVHHIVTGEHSVKSTLLRNEGFEILKEALK